MSDRDRDFSLRNEIMHVLNRHSAENISNTPDFILADYLVACLAAFDAAIQTRETWYDRDGRPSEHKVRIK